MSIFSPILHLCVFLSFFLKGDTQNRTVESLPKCDIDLLQFALNIEYLQAEFFLYGTLGHGLDVIAPDLTGGGTSPIGGEKANLQFFVRDVITQIAYQQVGHIRAIRRMVGGFPRPIMDLSSSHFAQLMEKVIGFPLQPPFDPYKNDLNFLLASYLFPYISLTGYNGITYLMNSTSTKRLSAGLMVVEAGQDTILRTILYQRALQPLSPYNYNVAEITLRLSKYRDRLAHVKNPKDDGIILATQDRNGGLTLGNIINGDRDSVAYSRTPWEILRILYETGSASHPGGFFPVGANGTIAQFYMHHGEGRATTCGIPPSATRRR
ncbi:hypothetical protein ACHQM5_016295 [Ranunculus cassubicifolius]